MSRARRIAVPTFLVLGALLVFVGVFSVWVNRQVLNTDNWVDTSGRLLANAEVREQLSTFLVDQAYENADVQAEIEAELPAATKQLAGPVAGGLRQLSERVADRALASAAFQGLWEEANRAAHESLLKILDGGGSFVSTGEGTVTLNLHDVLEGVIEASGLPPSVLEKLPPDAGQLAVLRSDQLDAAQRIAKLIRRLPIVLVGLAVVLFAAAIYLARGRRRETVRAVGFGFLFAGVAALAVRGIAGGAIVDALAATDSVEGAVDSAWGIGTSLLVEIAVSTLLFGLLLVVGAWALGPTRLARGLRRQSSPWMRERPAAAYLALGLLWLALIAWVPIAAFRTWLGILVFAALFAVGATSFRRQALAEYPDAERQSLGETMGGVRGAFAAARPESRPAADGPPDPVASLERLSSLRREGALSEEEFEAAKRKVLVAP